MLLDTNAPSRHSTPEIAFPTAQSGGTVPTPRTDGRPPRPPHAQRAIHAPLKTGLEYVLALILLVVLAPVILLTALLVRATSRGPAFYLQTRVGKGGRLFRIYKLRTMTNERGPDGQLLPDEQRLVGVGRLIRRASLDELPQLLNVVRGEMSLVGPRPDVLPLARYPIWQRDRFAVLPGITGLWQVSGKNATTFSEMVQLDIAYIHRRSMWLDLVILAETIPSLLFGQ